MTSSCTGKGMRARQVAHHWGARAGAWGGAGGQGAVALTMRYSLSSSSWLILCSAM